MPTYDQWRRLYEAAVLVKELSPWEWMTETDVFGVRDPETDEIGFVSVLGLLGEHFGVSLYPNPRALYGFWALEEAGPEVNPDALLEIPQLQASFEDLDQLDNRDRKITKELGLKFRGKKRVADVSQLSARVLTLVLGSRGSSLFGGGVGSASGSGPEVQRGSLTAGA